MAPINRARTARTTGAGDPSGSARRWRDGLVALGPFAVALVAYKGLLDYVLPDDWFSAAILKYLFAGVCALCVGLAVRLAAELYTAPADRPRGDLAQQAPQAGGAGGPLTGSRSGVRSVRRVIDESAQGVLAEFRVVRHRDAQLAGWSQYLDDHQVLPTAVGTSYGLRLVSALDIRDPRISRRQVNDSLLALQKPGGGWAASTQRDRGRCEITAWVLAAMCRNGLDDATKDELVRVLEQMLDPQADPLGMDRTTVLSVAVSTLAEIAPASPKLPWLARRLAEGARTDDGPAAPGAHWGEALHSPARSAAHTARAVVALHRASAVLSDGAVFANTARAGLDWLCGAELDLRSHDEQLRRPVDDGSVDALMIGHFTPAWVARALMLPLAPECDDRLERAVAETLDKYKDGVWRWHDGSKPIWMTYQGALVAREYALRTTAWT